MSNKNKSPKKTSKSRLENRQNLSDLNNSHQNLEENSDHEITIIKKANVNKASLNDIITYNILIQNTSDTEVFDLLVEDNSSDFTALVNGTFMINGVIVENVNLNYGVNIGSLNVGEEIMIQYEARVLISDCNGNILSTSSVLYHYYNKNSSVSTNISYSNVVKIYLNLEFSRSFIIDNSICIPNQYPDIYNVNWINGDVIIKNWHPHKSIRCDANCPDIVNGVRLIVHGKISYNIGYLTKNSNQEIRVEGMEAPFDGTIILFCNYDSEDLVNITGCVEDIVYQSFSPRCVECKTNLKLTASITH